MIPRPWLILSLLASLLLFFVASSPAPGCCAVGPSGKPVVNADQTVIILWDAATKTQHFIRQASFKSEADDFGFLIPSPTQPELAEAGNEAFPYLMKLTEPEKVKRNRPSNFNCGCGGGIKNTASGGVPASREVVVLQEKLVAGFNAAVLETKSASALVQWLKDNGYHYSPEVEAWAKPYVEAGWKITALKVAKKADGKADKNVSAAALRMTFQTDKPLFPYREPESAKAASTLGAKQRLLRVYVLADAKYRADYPDGKAWSGKVAWANKLTAEQKQKTLELLRLPSTTGPAEWWLTEFEDNWPYQTAPGDVYFARDPDQTTVKREPIVEYISSVLPTDPAVYALAGLLVLPPVVYRLRRGRKKSGAAS